MKNLLMIARPCRFVQDPSRWNPRFLALSREQIVKRTQYGRTPYFFKDLSGRCKVLNAMTVTQHAVLVRVVLHSNPYLPPGPIIHCPTALQAK